MPGQGPVHFSGLDSTKTPQKTINRICFAGLGDLVSRYSYVRYDCLPISRTATDKIAFWQFLKCQPWLTPLTHATHILKYGGVVMDTSRFTFPEIVVSMYALRYLHCDREWGGSFPEYWVKLRDQFPFLTPLQTFVLCHSIPEMDCPLYLFTTHMYWCLRGHISPSLVSKLTGQVIRTAVDNLTESMQTGHWSNSALHDAFNQCVLDDASGTIALEPGFKERDVRAAFGYPVFLPC